MNESNPLHRRDLGVVCITRYMRSQGVSLSKDSFEFHTASAVLGFSMKFLGGFCKLPSLQLIIMINKMDVEGSLHLLAAEMIMPTIIY